MFHGGGGGMMMIGNVIKISKVGDIWMNIYNYTCIYYHI